MGCRREDLGEEEVSVVLFCCWGTGCKVLTRFGYSGRVPSQAEWEELFSEGRIGWDDKGIHRKYLGC